jgi:hypothetical protein
LKTRVAIIQLLLSGAFLFALLYPSFDGIGHLEETLAEKHCDHKYAQGKNEINHSHHELEKCFACEFTFSQFINTDIISFGYKRPIIHSGYTISKSKEITQFFRGSLFAHRGPPQFIA